MSQPLENILKSYLVARPEQMQLPLSITSPATPTTTKLSNFLRTFAPPSEDEIDKAFIHGTKSICNLLKQDKIDYETTKEILEIFASLYVESKIDSSIRRYVSKKSKANLLLDLLESELKSK